ncbi:MAG: glycosyltransferase family 2 protein [Candidatus Nanopelagicales bacterium]
MTDEAGQAGVAPPPDVVALAEQRAAARAERDFTAADRLRVAIGERGWAVADTADGFALAPRPPFEVHPTIAALLAAGPSVPVAALTVGLVVDGWPDDVDRCIEALLAHAPDGTVVLGLDCGNASAAGEALHRQALAHPGRVVDLHLSGVLDSVGWSAAVVALLTLATSGLVAIMDLSTVLDGDALSPIVAVLDDEAVVASGWRGVDVDLADGWRSFVDAGPGEVDAILGYLVVVRRAAGLASPPHPKARFYRNADMEWSLALREAGGRLVVPDAALPVHQARHHGYHDSPPEFRDRESRRTYDRLLARFRGKDSILRPRDPGTPA